MVRVFVFLILFALFSADTTDAGLPTHLAPKKPTPTPAQFPRPKTSSGKTASKNVFTGKKLIPKKYSLKKKPTLTKKQAAAVAALRARKLHAQKMKQKAYEHKVRAQWLRTHQTSGKPVAPVASQTIVKPGVQPLATPSVRPPPAPYAVSPVNQISRVPSRVIPITTPQKGPRSIKLDMTRKEYR